MVRTYKRRTRGSGGRARSRAGYGRKRARAAAISRRRYRRRYAIPQRAVTPKTKLAKLKYTQLVTLNPGPGAIANHLFCCNGAYDPDVTGTGHQPLGFDQYMVWYDHYTVIGAKITVTGVNEDTVNEMIVGLHKNDDTATLPTTTSHACELPSVHYKVVRPRGAGSGDGFKLVGKWGIKADSDFVGHNVGSNELRGTASSNPSERKYFNIFAGPIGSADLPSTNVWVHIEYLVVFSEPKEFGQS